MHLGLYRTTFAAAGARFFNELGVLRSGKMINRGVGSIADGNSENLRIKISDKERGQPQSMNSSTYEEDISVPSVSICPGKSERKVTCSEQKPEVSKTKNVVPLQRHEPSDSGTCSGQESVVQNIGPLQREAPNSIAYLKQNSEEVHNIVPSQCEASSSIIDHNDTGLLTSSWKKPLSSSRNPKVRQTNYEHQEAKSRSKPSSSTPIDDNHTYLLTSFEEKPLSSPRNLKLLQTHHEHRESKRRPKPSPITPIDEPFDICPPETTESTTPENFVNKRNRRMWSPMRQSDEENEQNNCITEKVSSTVNLVEEPGLVLGPGMVLLKHYIPLLEQVNIVNKCRELGCGPGGFYRPGYNDGAKLRLYMMCLGLDWNPQTASYGDRRRHDNAAPPDIPSEFTSLACRALDDSHNLIERNVKVDNFDLILPKMSPDVCIVNFYTSNGRLGLHQDRDETRESLDKGLPVISISIGDSAEFLYGNQRDVNKAKSVSLESGDVLIFGGESRLIYHGVRAIIPDTAPPALLESTRFRSGRLNLTFRKY